MNVKKATILILYTGKQEECNSIFGSILTISLIQLGQSTSEAPREIVHLIETSVIPFIE